MIKLAVPVEMVTRHGAPHCRTVAEDSGDEIAQCVYAVCATELGQRLEMPAFGIPDPAFIGADPVTLRAAITEWEPRADGLGTESWDELMQTVEVRLQ